MHYKLQPVVFTVSCTNIINKFMIYNAVLFFEAPYWHGQSDIIQNQHSKLLLHLITELWEKFTCEEVCSSSEVVVKFQMLKLKKKKTVPAFSQEEN